MWRWVENLFRRGEDRRMTEIDTQKVVLERLWWLADAPLFIDEQLVTSFYDAVVRPEFELQGKTIGEINEKTNTLLVGGGGEVKLGLPSFLSFLGADAKSKVEGKLEHTREKSNQATEEYDWTRVRTAGRKFEELVAVYVADQRFHSRLLFTDCPTSGIQTLNGAAIAFDAFERANDSFPRTLVFLEVKPGAAIIPTMCEFTRGGFAPLSENLIGRLWNADAVKPEYPNEESPTASADRRAYWKAIGDKYDSHVAMQVLEAAATTDQKLDWIDFRLRLSADGQTVHLHACPRGLHPAGTFGYNFIRRGNRKGIRIVGSLKRGPDLNVLAIFEC